jgi:hypothetical protein
MLARIYQLWDWLLDQVIDAGLGILDWLLPPQETEVGPVGYGTVLKTMKAAGIELTGRAAAASERMRRRHADPDFAAATSARMKRLKADPVVAAAAEIGRGQSQVAKGRVGW